MRRLPPLLALLGLASWVTAQTFRERVDVDLVRVEVLALDGKGQPVGGLKASNFTVRVDGKPVKSESFEEPRSAALPAPQAPAPLPSLPVAVPRAAAEAPPAAAAPPPAPAQSYFMAILVDETSSEQSNRQATLREVFRFLEEGLPPGVEALLMRFDGRLNVECPWTSDGERLRRCTAAIAAHKVAPRLGQPGQSNDPALETSLLQLDAMEAVGHVRTSLAGLFDALRVFPEKPGRKALYVVSDGAPFLAPSDIVKDLVATSATQNDTALATPRMQMEAQYDRDLLLDGLAWDRTRSASLLTDISRLALVRGIEIHPVRSMPHDASNNVRADRGFNSRATARGAGPMIRARNAAGSRSP